MDRKPGALPVILSKDFPIWEPVLEATSALDMAGIREYILDQLAGDLTSIPSSPEKLLRWGISSSHQSLILEMLRFFAYRRLPLSEEEVITLGEHAARVMFVRERVRTTFLSNPLVRFGRDISPHNMCSKRTECRKFIIEAIVQNMTGSPNEIPKDDASDIFQVTSNRVCAQCQPIKLEMARTLRKGDLDDILRESSEGHVPNRE
ncbi:unnamed protein product [Rhizoctonia solani]|uniref:Uncharacterized protein n=1 Tax=Rhizoctonia solani TaxID=456999 RepID=A0A8H2W9W4_9AGAM|nr:unnamed protein product [Rhizoctonia solani]